MVEGYERSIVAHFKGLDDPRTGPALRHNLLAIVTIALCGVICGADNWVEIEELGRAKETGFAAVLDLPHGIPSHDTFGRVFAALDPVRFEACFRSWITCIAQVLAPQVIVLDGKALCRAHTAGEQPLQMVSAWASEARLVLAQRAVCAKSNELSALPEILQMLALEGCIVTIDAMGTHASIAQAIRERGETTSSLLREIKDVCRRRSRPSSRTPRTSASQEQSTVMTAPSMADMGVLRSVKPGS